MSKLFLLSLLGASLLCGCSASAPTKAACQVGQHSIAELTVLKANIFESLAAPERNQLALDMLQCVGAPDPEMRDGIVYESLAKLLRGKLLSTETQVEIFNQLIVVLNGPDSADGFLKPFAALVLSETVRVDRIEVYLSPEQRQSAVQTTADYLVSITDYRGFIDGEGWRHGVAHTADIILQLSLNPNIDATQLSTLRAAIQNQIVPTNGHAYRFGEAERLARPLLYMARRGALTQENWDIWFEGLTSPEPFTAWNEVYTSEAGMAKLHNTKAFLNTLYVNATETKNENIKMLLPGARKALISLP